MHDTRNLTPFERRLARELGDHVASVNDPRPAAEIAATAMRARRSPLARLAWPGGSPMAVPVPIRLALVAALVGAALYLGLLVAGGHPTLPVTRNGAVAFPAPDAATGHSAITLVQATGGTSTVKTDPATDASCPAWSPGGSRLAWVETSEDRTESRIVVADGDGGHPRTITTHRVAESGGVGGGAAIHALSWSPDGQSIAYVSGPALWVVPSAGGEARVAVPVVWAGSSAAWSPDSRRLAAVGVLPDRGFGVETVAPDGSDPKILARVGKPDPGGYAWSPDGRMIAYAYGDLIWLVDSTGAADPFVATPEASTSLTPFWSPDSKTLAYVDGVRNGDALETASIWLKRMDRPPIPGNLFTPHVAGIGAGLANLTWSPDGMWLLVVGHKDNTYSVVRVPVTGGPFEPVATFEAQTPTAAIEDCPVAWQDNGIQPVP